ncbi:MAG: 16S rRNA (adenine(1518)-N(6)/adenine(1519)-N(6))-dimethyltransferase RsmA [Polyangia bacterium]
MTDPVDPLPEDPRAVLRRHGLAAKRSWGQSFMISRRALREIATLAGDAPGRTVVEVGAGAGTLTGALLQREARVVAIERDRDMCRVLRAELGSSERLELVEEDAARFDYASRVSGGRGAIAGNIPYQITGRILRRVLDISPPPLRVVVTVQLEVAERLCARAGEPSRAALSALTRARFEPRMVLRLAPTAFFPPPKVRSAVVHLEPLPRPVFETPELAPRYDRLVKAAFLRRRKTLCNSLAAAGLGEKRKLEKLIEKTGIDPRARAETLTEQQLAALARTI